MRDEQALDRYPLLCTMHILCCGYYVAATRITTATACRCRRVVYLFMLHSICLLLCAFIPFPLISELNAQGDPRRSASVAEPAHSNVDLVRDSPTHTDFVVHCSTCPTRTCHHSLNASASQVRQVPTRPESLVFTRPHACVGSLLAVNQGVSDLSPQRGDAMHCYTLQSSQRPAR